MLIMVKIKKKQYLKKKTVTEIFRKNRKTRIRLRIRAYIIILEEL